MCLAPARSRGEGRRSLLGFVPWIGGVVAVLLCLPSLGAGLQTEDHLHLVMARSTRGWVNLFGDGSDRVIPNYQAKDAGTLPWVAVSDLRVQLFRPLASLTHLVDYRLFPDRPWLMHAESLAWLAALVVAVGFLHRCTARTARGAWLATLFYAMDDARGVDVGWLANRNALVSGAFAALAVVLHDRARARGSLREFWLSAAALGMGLLGGETALGGAAYLVSHALTLDRAPLRDRLRAAAPWIAVVAAWAVAYRALGFGAHGSGVYLDPLGQPAEFLHALAWRGPLLLVSAVSGLPTEVIGFGGPLAVALVAAPLVLGALAAGSAFRARPGVRFAAIGTLLAVIPASATMPSDRLLTCVGMGSAALVGALLDAVLTRAASSARLPLAARAGALCLALVHGVLSPLALPWRSRGLVGADRAILEGARTAFAGARGPGRELILVTVPDLYASMLLLSVPAAMGARAPGRVRVLHGGTDPVTLSRDDARTVRLRAPAGFLRSPGNRLFRGKSFPIRAGDGLPLTHVFVRVTEVDRAGEPLEATFTFDRPLGDRRFVWKYWDGLGFSALRPPAVGDTLVLVPGQPVRRLAPRRLIASSG